MKTGFFRAVHKLDGVGQENDGKPFIDCNVLTPPGAECGSPMYEVLVLNGLVEGGEWILACEHDLTFRSLSPPCQEYSRAGSRT